MYNYKQQCDSGVILPANTLWSQLLSISTVCTAKAIISKIKRQPKEFIVMPLHLLPQLLLEGGMPYNLTCGISDRNDTFLKKGFIIICFLEGLHLQNCIPFCSAIFLKIHIYNYISPWLHFFPSLWTISLRVVTSGAG